VRLIITGTVQGVFYRAWTVETASGLGLDGWVRNNADGTVEAVAAGPAEAVDRLVRIPFGRRRLSAGVAAAVEPSPCPLPRASWPRGRAAWRQGRARRRVRCP
jgi:acylphosphatase